MFLKFSSVRFDYFYNGKRTLRGRRKDFGTGVACVLRGCVLGVWCAVALTALCDIGLWLGEATSMLWYSLPRAFWAALVRTPPLLPRSPTEGFGRRRSHLAPCRLPAQLHKAIAPQWSRGGGEGSGGWAGGKGPLGGGVCVLGGRDQSLALSWQSCGLLHSSLCLLRTYITHSQDFIFQKIESKATVDFLQKDLFGSAIAWNYMVAREARPCCK